MTVGDKEGGDDESSGSAISTIMLVGGQQESMEDAISDVICKREGRVICATLTSWRRGRKRATPHLPWMDHFDQLRVF